MSAAHLPSNRVAPTRLHGAEDTHMQRPLFEGVSADPDRPITRRAFVGTGGMAGGLAALGALPAAALAAQGSAETVPTTEPAPGAAPAALKNASPPLVV